MIIYVIGLALFVVGFVLGWIVGPCSTCMARRESIEHERSMAMLRQALTSERPGRANMARRESVEHERRMAMLRQALASERPGRAEPTPADTPEESQGS